MCKDTEEITSTNDIFSEKDSNIINRTNSCFSFSNKEEKQNIINKGILYNSVNYFNIPKIVAESPNDPKTININNVNIINFNESSLFNNDVNNKLLMNLNLNNELIYNNSINNFNNNMNNSNININSGQNKLINYYQENQNNKIPDFNLNNNIIGNNFLQNKNNEDSLNNNIYSLKQVNEEIYNSKENSFINYINGLKIPLIKYLSTKKGIYEMENYLNVNRAVNISILLRLLNKEGLSKLMKNIFGNYFIQGIIKNANYSQIKLILILISDNFVEISENNSGTYAIQKLLGKINTIELRYLVLKYIENKELEMAMNNNATYVIQKIIEIIPDTERLNLNNMILNNFLFLSINSECIFIIERFIDTITIIENKIKIQNLIYLNCLKLCDNPYGNYLIQYILKIWKNKDIQNIINIIINNANYLIQQKFSSNVIEKSIEIFDNKSRKMMIWKICVEGDILSVIKNQYGHYVLNKTIKYMDNDIKTEIEKILMNKLPEMTKKERTKSKKFITIMKSNKFEIKHRKNKK